MLLILRIRICCMIKTESGFLFNISCITKQVGIRRFSQYFLVFFFLFSERKDKISSFAFVKISISIYCIFEPHLEMKKTFKNWKFTSQSNTFPRRHLLVQSQQWNHQNNMGNLFKDNTKDNRTTSMTTGFKL